MTIPRGFFQPFGDPLNALEVIKVLCYLDPFSINFPAAAERAGIDFDVPASSVVTVPKTAVVSNCVLVTWQNSVGVYCGGTDGTQVPGFLAAWGSDDQWPEFAGANNHLAYAAATLRDLLPAHTRNPGLNWYIAGHSYGGATAEVLGAYVLRHRQPQSLNVWTFGAPRPGWSRFQDQSRGMNIWRYFNDTDPVPSIPPHTPEAPILHYPLPNALARGINQQCQIHGGIRIDPQGLFSYTNEQTLPLGIHEPSIAAWLIGSNAFGAQAHSPNEYFRRLVLSPRPSVPELGPNRSPPVPPEEPVDISVRYIHQLTDAALEAQPTATLPATLPPFVPGPVEERYRIKRRRRGWAVWYKGELIATCRTKDAARQIARAGNAANRTNARITAM